MFNIFPSKIKGGGGSNSPSPPPRANTWSKHEGGISDYMVKVIESNTLPGNLEILILELILHKTKILLMSLYKATSLHCVKSVHIRSYPGPNAGKCRPA